MDVRWYNLTPCLDELSILRLSFSANKEHSGHKLDILQQQTIEWQWVDG